MDRIYDAAQQGLLACLIAGEAEDNLASFLTRLKSDEAWSASDVAQVEQEIRRLLLPGVREQPTVLPFQQQSDAVVEMKAGRTA